MAPAVAATSLVSYLATLTLLGLSCHVNSIILSPLTTTKHKRTPQDRSTGPSVAFFLLRQRHKLCSKGKMTALSGTARLARVQIYGLAPG